MTDDKLDVTGLTCPGPLVETRKKLKHIEIGQILEVIGDHGPSKKEIPEMLEEVGQEVQSVMEDKGIWTIKIKKLK